MQVERKPNRWPYMGVLVGLLGACLLAPRYWHGIESANGAITERADTDNATLRPMSASLPASRAIHPFRYDCPYLIAPRPGLDSMAVTGLLPPAGGWPASSWTTGLGAPAVPTLDELIWSLSRSNDHWPNDGDPPIPIRFQYADMHTATVIAQTDELRAPAPSLPGPRVTAALRWLGTIAVDYTRVGVGRWLGSSLSHVWDDVNNRPLGTELSEKSAIGPIGPELSEAGSEGRSHVDAASSQGFEAPVAEDLQPVVAATSPAVEPTTAGGWIEPDALVEQLVRLGQHPYCAYWATETMSQLRSLLHVRPLPADEANALLTALGTSAEAALHLAEQTTDDRMRVELLRAHWSLARRIDCWSGMQRIRLAAVERARLAARGSSGSLLSGIAERSDLLSLNSGLESYEMTRDPAVAFRLAQAQRQLHASADPLDVALADSLEQHYRNANIRLALTADMLNRFVPAQNVTTNWVRDRIAGTPVRGTSQTASESRLLLMPATGRWHLELESQGSVDSNTLADGGQARVHSYGSTDFTVRKPIIVEEHGVRLEPATVEARNYSHLAGVTTDFDWVPFLGSFVRSRAIDEYRAKRPRARAEVEWKVAAQAGERLDTKAAEAVARVEREVREQVTGPLEEFGVALTPIELATTPERVVARLRLAGEWQLGGHTPRPRAPSDSLASVQVHETAFANAAVGLGLDGRRLTSAELQSLLRQKLPRLASPNPPDEPDPAVFHFADRGAVRFRIEGGRFEIAVAVAEFVRERHATRNFIVHAYYVPVVNGLSAELVRDGALGIEGRLTAADRARLYSVFNEVLSAERRLPVVRLDDPNDRRFAGLMITQFVLEDGWLGVAFGPEAIGRTAERIRSLR